MSETDAARIRSTTDSHVVIDGRRWRRTDPAIDEGSRQALVDELMSARRAVKAGKSAGDENAVGAARRRVQDAKVALGERGPTWWEPVDAADVGARRDAARRALASRRDVARLVDGLHLDEL